MKKLILLAVLAAYTALFATALFAKMPISCLYRYCAGECAVKSALPEYLLPLLDEKEPLISDIYEYRDAILVDKQVAIKGTNGGVYIVCDSPALKGTAKGKPWFGFRNGANSREQIYSVTEKDGDSLVIALISRGIDETHIDREELVVDRILSEKINNKTVVIRYSVPGGFLQSHNTGHNTQIPEWCKMLSDKVIELVYKDGAVEHWILIPDREDVENNLKKFKEANRLLVWWNGAGKGSGSHDHHKAWNYNENKEPEYEDAWSEAAGGNALPRRQAADRRENTGVWKRLLAAVISIRNKLSGLFNIG
ncbi:MAG: hypothetical protein ILO36_09425 [Abditibacteriota bacterium]|nr:hypothetical protein [Abditibacteriota bacterium]